MDRLRIHDLSKSREEIELERALRFAALDDTEKFRQWLTLMNIARKINGGRPLKVPQVKGYVFKKEGYCEILMDHGMYADLMAQLPGLNAQDFELHFAMASVVEIERTQVRFLHYNTLSKTKKQQGVPKTWSTLLPWKLFTTAPTNKWAS